MALTASDILGRLASLIVSLALDPPVPIQIYPGPNWPDNGEPVPPPSSYPYRIYWGYPPPGAADGTDPAYPVGSLFVWSQAAEISHDGSVVNELLDLVPFTDLIALPLHTAGVPMQYLQTQIHAKLGTEEQMIHALKWAPDGGGAVPAVTDAAVLDFGNAVRTLWDSTFLDTAVRAWLHSSVTYDEVRTGVYEQTVPNVSGASTIGHNHQIRGTQVSLFSGAVGTAGGTALPWEVAMVATLRTAFPQSGGVSHGRRNRGRTYLGGFSTAVMSSGARFGSAVTANVRDAFAAFASAVNAATVYHLAVVSFADLQDRTVNLVQVGSVPDVIRKRRNAQDELYPVGAAVT